MNIYKYFLFTYDIVVHSESFAVLYYGPLFSCSTCLIQIRVDVLIETKSPARAVAHVVGQRRGLSIEARLYGLPIELYAN